MVKTEDNGLMEDLIVTGGHSILVDEISKEEQEKYDAMNISAFSNTLIDGKHLLLSCVSDQFVPLQDETMYSYYHLLLESTNDEDRY
jgi:hypothetical protein